jgi:type IV pilus assembly protein PilF
MKRLILVLPILALLALTQTGCVTTEGGGIKGGGSAAPPVAKDERARVYTELAAGYYARGQFSVALEDVRKAIGFESGYAPAYSVLALIHAELKEDQKAEENFRRALDLAPAYAEAHNNYGLFLCQRQRQKESLSHFEAALANTLYATPERALANAGACILEAGDITAAEGYFTRSLKREPRQYTASLGLAEVRYRQGHYLAARSLLNYLMSQSEPTPQALWLAVRLERRLGDREAEAAYISKLRKRFPESIQAQWSTTGQYDQHGSLL